MQAEVLHGVPGTLACISIAAHAPAPPMLHRPASAGRSRPAAGPGPSLGPGAVSGSGAPGPYPGHGEGPSYDGGGSRGATHAGMRDKIRPASAGAKNVWNEVQRELPKAPPHATTTGTEGGP